MSQEVNPTEKNQEFVTKLDKLIKKHGVFAHVSAYSLEDGQSVIGVSGNTKVISRLISEILKATLEDSVKQILAEPDKKESLTVDDLKELETLYKDALSNGKTQIMFKGEPLITDYAKYLIEYLKTLKK